MVKFCEHKFEIEKLLESQPMVQILKCQLCGLRFFGYGGTVKNPDFIHVIKKPILKQELENLLSMNVNLEE